jgi:hypothetical protein
MYYREIIDAIFNIDCANLYFILNIDFQILY